jgi:hypothetical protein
MKQKTLLSVILISILTSCGTERSKPLSSAKTTIDPIVAAQPTEVPTEVEQLPEAPAQNDTVALVYGKAEFDKVYVSPTESSESKDHTLYNITFSTGDSESASFTARFIDHGSDDLFFVNHNIAPGRFDAKNYYYEIDTPNKEIFESVTKELAANENAKKAIMTIARINNAQNRIAYLVLDSKKIESLNYEEFVTQFSNPANATLNLFELGTTYVFNTKDGENSVSFEPDAVGWRAILETLVPTELE